MSTIDLSEFSAIPHLDGKYFINRRGDVYSVHSGRLLTLHVNKNGYIDAPIHDGVRSLHRLLMLTFVPNPYGYPHVNHIDGNRQNNDLSNLEWCSPAYNAVHGAYRRQGTAIVKPNYRARYIKYKKTTYGIDYSVPINPKFYNIKIVNLDPPVYSRNRLHMAPEAMSNPVIESRLKINLDKLVSVESPKIRI